MTNPLAGAMAAAESGLKAQSLRMRVIAENIANQDSLATTPGDEPYRRRTVTFRATIDRASGGTIVRPGAIVTDAGALEKRHMPGHPAADAAGYVQVPNVNGLVESADMRAAQRGYEANINVIEASRSMQNRTLDLLR